MSTSSPIIVSRVRPRPEQGYGRQRLPAGAGERRGSSTALAAAITRAASKQTYYTVRFLVDGARTDGAYQAYAYFRWVDDRLDQGGLGPHERERFIARQQALVAGCYRSGGRRALSTEERMLVELVDGDRDENGGLRAYIENMMAVMAFDAERRGRLISEAELDGYTHWLAVAVTEALHHFIGHASSSPQGDARYLAATAAHITHMLRDTMEDAETGYYNVPREYLSAHGIGPQAWASEPYRRWVQDRVQLARDYFRAGKAYLAQVENGRCRLAGCAYIARFEGVLDAIEREGYRLRAGYPECKGSKTGMKAIGLALALGAHRRSAAQAGAKGE